MSLTPMGPFDGLLQSSSDPVEDGLEKMESEMDFLFPVDPNFRIDDWEAQFEYALPNQPTEQAVRPKQIPIFSVLS